MVKLNQVVAIEKGVKSRVHTAVSELYKKVQRSDLFSGVTRTYEKRFDDGEDFPNESMKIRARVDETLLSLRKLTSELVDITVQKDESNLQALADIKLPDGTTISAVPVTTLIYLEKQVTDLRTFVSKLPVLDDAHWWSFDAKASIYKSDPKKTHKTKKVSKPIVRYEATAVHPAQTEMVSEDEVVGYWSTTQNSAAIPEADKQGMLDRADILINAIKQAREQANNIEAEPRRAVGGAIFDYLKIGG